MRNISTLALLLALLLSVTLATPTWALASDEAGGDAAEEKAAPAPPSNLPPGMTIYYMVFLHSCPDKPEEDPEKLQQIQAAHMANIGAMAEEGILRLAGPFAPVEGSDLAGIFLLEMDSLEAAEERTAKDPAVQAGRLCPKIIPWLGPVDITHGYDEAVAKAQG
ncbi:MAG: YciI family protein [Acidobacteriota bacterium]|nr:YciI family protein [Acidobacteriota bacterium]